MNRSTPPEAHSSWEKQASQPMSHGRKGGHTFREKKDSRCAEAQGMASSPPWTWPQEYISQALWCHSMWTLKRRIRKGKEGPVTIPLICHSCYTYSLTEPSYPQKLLLSLYRHKETGLPRLRKQPKSPSGMHVFSLEHWFSWRCAHVTNDSVGKAKDLEGTPREPGAPVSAEVAAAARLLGLHL